MFRLVFNEQPSDPLWLTYDQYTILAAEHIPEEHAAYIEHAILVEHKEGNIQQDDDFLYLAVWRDQQQWPFLVVTQRYGPGPYIGFNPGILIIPETSLLFIGAGECLLAYQLDLSTKLWEDRADVGFLGWERYRDTFIMYAEVELAVWDIRGKKLWTSFVEPPWDYHLDESTIHIDVMGTKAAFSLYEGPRAAKQWW